MVHNLKRNKGSSCVLIVLPLIAAMCLEKPFLLIQILLLLQFSRRIVVVDFLCFHDNVLPSHLTVSSLISLPPSPPVPLLTLHQSKQEAGGLGCDVVRVEVEESLTKEQLLETFITCGRDTHTLTSLERCRQI